MSPDAAAKGRKDRGPAEVPELNSGVAPSGVMLLVGGMLILLGRRRGARASGAKAGGLLSGSGAKAA